MVLDEDLCPNPTLAKVSELWQSSQGEAGLRVHVISEYMASLKQAHADGSLFKTLVEAIIAAIRQSGSDYKGPLLLWVDQWTAPLGFALAKAWRQGFQGGKPSADKDVYVSVVDSVVSAGSAMVFSSQGPTMFIDALHHMARLIAERSGCGYQVQRLPGDVDKPLLETVQGVREHVEEALKQRAMDKNQGEVLPTISQAEAKASMGRLFDYFAGVATAATDESLLPLNDKEKYPLAHYRVVCSKEDKVTTVSPYGLFAEPAQEKGLHRFPRLFECLDRFERLLTVAHHHVPHALREQRSILRAVHPYVLGEARLSLRSPLFHQLFDHYASATPQALALQAEDNVSWTYDKLNRTANQIAHWLMARRENEQWPEKVCIGLY